MRFALRAGVARAPARTFLPAVQTAAATASRAPAPRYFSNTASRSLLGGSLKGTYQVLGASERLFKVCAKPADYHITEEERKNDLVKKLEDGEEVGHSVDKDNVWHNSKCPFQPLSRFLKVSLTNSLLPKIAFKLPPTFSTWSHVTMLHLYLINARLRCFELDECRNWQQQMVDHFFFECEKKMHLDHSITSSALRQRYLKDIFVQWRGLLLAYDEGLVKGDAILASAVWRNLFKGAPEVDPRALVAIVGWMRSSLASLESTSDMTFMQAAGEVLNKPVDVFWKRLEEPFKKSQEGAAGTEAPNVQAQKPAAQ